MGYLTSDNFLTNPLWFDQQDAEQQLQAKLRGGIINQAEANLISNFRNDGYAVVDIDGIDGAINSLLRGVESLWQHPPFDLACAGPRHGRPLPMSEGVSKFGREPGVRLMDIHSHVEGAQQLYLNEQLHRLCSILFGAQAIATQSLYFEYGSTQSLHRDPWYVNHNPRSHLLAAWFALEDIHPDSGPLNYVAGSHKLPYFRFKTNDIVFHDPRVSDQERRAAVDAMQGQIAANGLRPAAALPKRGQVFLWHGSLIHGGSPVINPGLTRRSFVVHFGRVDTHPQRGGGLFCEGVNRTFFTTKVCTSEAGMRGWQSPLAGITREDFFPALNNGKSTQAVASMPAPVKATCAICGGMEFGAGPGGRMSLHGKAPRCLQCDSLEIQRANHLVFSAVPADFLNWRRALQIGAGTGLDASDFLSLDVLPAPSASKQAVPAAAQGQYDLISMNQVFEYVQDDLALLAEVARRMTPRSILHVCFSGIARRGLSLHGADAGAGLHHRYGADVLSHFNCLQLGLHSLAVQVEDTCTGTLEIVYLFVKDLPDLAMLRQCFKLAKNETMRLL